MFRQLLKIRLGSFLSGFGKNKKAKKQSVGIKILMGFLFIYVFFAIFGMFFGIFSTLATTIFGNGYDWYYFALADIISFLLCFIGSVFTTQTQMFNAKDNELLLSMPIKPSCILGSRMFFLYCSNWLYSICVFIPAIIVYCGMSTSMNAGSLIVFILQAFTVPLISLAIGCLLGWALSYISARIKYKNIFRTFFSLIFMVVYFYFVFNMNSIFSAAENIGIQQAQSLKSSFLPAFWFGSAVSDLNIVMIILTFLSCIVLTALIYLFISKFFITIVTTKRGGNNTKYKQKKMKEQNPVYAVVRKELNRFFSLTVYILNCGLGCIMFIIGAVVAAIKQKDIIAALSVYPDLIPLVPYMLMVAMCVLCSLADISAASISLEGKNIWIMRSFPIKTENIIMGKLLAHCIICMPPLLISDIIMIISFKMNFIQSICMIIVPALAVICTDVFGLCMNLFFPKLEWINEAVAVKQGLSVFFAIFGSMVFNVILAGICFGLYMLGFNGVLVSIIIGIIFIIVSLIFGLLSFTVGKKKFEQLG